MVSRRIVLAVTCWLVARSRGLARHGPSRSGCSATAADETCSCAIAAALLPPVDTHRQPSCPCLPLLSTCSYERAAQQGKTDSKFMLGSCYYEGNGCKQQDKKLG